MRDGSKSLKALLRNARCPYSSNALLCLTCHKKGHSSLSSRLLKKGGEIGRERSKRSKRVGRQCFSPLGAGGTRVFSPRVPSPGALRHTRALTRPPWRAADSPRVVVGGVVIADNVNEFPHRLCDDYAAATIIMPTRGRTMFINAFDFIIRIRSVSLLSSPFHHRHFTPRLQRNCRRR